MLPRRWRAMCWELGWDDVTVKPMAYDSHYFLYFGRPWCLVNGAYVVLDKPILIRFFLHLIRSRCYTNESTLKTHRNVFRNHAFEWGHQDFHTVVMPRLYSHRLHTLSFTMAVHNPTGHVTETRSMFSIVYVLHTTVFADISCTQHILSAITPITLGHWTFFFFLTLIVAKSKTNETFPSFRDSFGYLWWIEIDSLYLADVIWFNFPRQKQLKELKEVLVVVYCTNDQGVLVLVVILSWWTGS